MAQQTTRERIGFIGLGRMGLPMAVNLMRGGYPVALYNRTRSRAEEALTTAGVDGERSRIAGSAADAATDASVVISMLADPPAVEAMLLGPQGALAAMLPGSLLIEMSTISPALVRRLGVEADSRGVRLLDAPVGGSVPQATAAELRIMVGGDEADIAAADAIFRTLGAHYWRLGGRGMGATMKLVNNSLGGSILAALGEVITFGEAMGLDPALMVDIMLGGVLGAPMLRAKAPLMTDETYQPAAFALGLMEKDLALAVATAREAAVPLPIVSTVQALFLAGKAAGHADNDMAAIADVSRRLAGRRSSTGVESTQV